MAIIGDVTAATIRFFILAGGGVAGFGSIGWLISHLFAGIAADIARLVKVSDGMAETQVSHGERLAAVETWTGLKTPGQQLPR